MTKPRQLIPLVFVGVIVVGGIEAGALETGQTTTPELIGGAAVSTPAREFAATLSPDGKSLYFNRSGENGAWHIWMSVKQGSSFSEAQPLWFSDPRYADLDPFVSRTGDRLYFSSDRPLPGSDSEEPTVDTNTWFAVKTKEGWGAPVFAGDVVNSEASETFVSESAAGELLFARFGEGKGRARPAYLMLAKRTGSGFSAPVQLETKPSGLRLTNPAISPDGKLIIAAGSQGDSPKLYFSRKEHAGNWEEFRALPAPVNVEGSVQFAPYISNDGKWLYFSSRGGEREGAGSDDIYRIPLPGLISQ